ncbi:MAG TPA: methyltransferase domain-containing protein [Flavobacterium sp.]|jgi:2-polyprenyl-3-methyl-5-hydroxy-6-metoxy-1,4-benzoquinol methylase
MLVKTKHRTDATEIMDDFEMEGEVLRDALDKIARINQLLGGNKLTLQGLKKLLATTDTSKPKVIVDIGCGNGDMLRAIAKYGMENNYHFNLIGIDANAFTIKHAEQLSINFPNITYQCIDIFDPVFNHLKCDIILCTLTLHHFKDEQIQHLVHLFRQQASTGIVINDLHRSAVAYRCFQLIAFFFGLNYMSRQDGLTSILRGFKKRDLLHFSKKLHLKNYIIQWKWAFRYQWIIMNNPTLKIQ